MAAGMALLLLLAMQLLFTVQAQQNSSTAAVPEIELSSCNKEKGCVRKPEDCSTSKSCEQIITWTVSPANSNYVRFEMMATLADKIQYFAFALAPDASNFMSNASVLVCGIDAATSKPTAYLAHNTPMKATVLAKDQYQVGVNLIRSEVTGSRLLCVVDRAILPTAQQAGLVFALDKAWYLAWALGPNENGVLGYHGSNKQSFDKAVTCTNSSSSLTIARSRYDKDLYRRIHGIFMMMGWMACVGASVLTPRYLRIHWIFSRICGVQLWFVIHRALMVAGIVFVIIGFVLILVINDGLIINYTPLYPLTLHPYFGVIAVSCLFLNPIVSFFRCAPTHPKRLIFNWIHGLIGAIGFLSSVAALIIGGYLYYSAAGSQALWPIIAWVLLHFTVEILFLLITFLCRPRPREVVQVAMQELSAIAGEAATTNPASNYTPSRSPRKPAAFYLSTILFIFYFISSIGLTVVASVFLFIKV